MSKEIKIGTVEKGISKNLEKEKLKRLISWMKGEPMPPFKMLIYPTNRCNLDCIFCNCTYMRKAGKYNYKNELKMKEWTRIVKEGIDFGIRRWWIIGAGEPILRKETVLNMIKLVKECEFETEFMITTNGTLFTEKLIKKFVQIGVDRIHFSLDAPTAEINDYLRGKNGVFDQCLKTIKNFVRTKKSLKSEKPFLCINSVLTSMIHDKIGDLIELAASVGVEKVVINPLRLEPLSTDPDVLKYVEKERVKALILSEKEKRYVKHQYDYLKYVAKKRGIIFELAGIRERGSLKEKSIKEGKSSPFISCFEPFLTLLIGPLGNVGFCCGSGYENSDLNIRGNTLKELWFGNTFYSIREKLMNGKVLPACWKCGMRHMGKRTRESLKHFIGK